MTEPRVRALDRDNGLKVPCDVCNRSIVDDIQWSGDDAVLPRPSRDNFYLWALLRRFSAAVVAHTVSGGWLNGPEDSGVSGGVGVSLDRTQLRS